MDGGIDWEQSIVPPRDFVTGCRQKELLIVARLFLAQMEGENYTADELNRGSAEERKSGAARG